MNSDERQSPAEHGQPDGAAGRCDGAENHDYYIIGGGDEAFDIGCKNGDCRWSDEQVASDRVHLAGMPDTGLAHGSWRAPTTPTWR